MRHETARCWVVVMLLLHCRSWRLPDSELSGARLRLAIRFSGNLDPATDAANSQCPGHRLPLRPSHLASQRSVAQMEQPRG